MAEEIHSRTVLSTWGYARRSGDTVTDVLVRSCSLVRGSGVTKRNRACETRSVKQFLVSHQRPNRPARAALSHRIVPPIPNPSALQKAEPFSKVKLCLDDIGFFINATDVCKSLKQGSKGLFARLLTCCRTRERISQVLKSQATNDGQTRWIQHRPANSQMRHVPPGPNPALHIRRICCSFMYFSSPVSRCCHHSKSIDSQMSLNQGVNLRLGSLNISLSFSAETYCVACTSFGLGARSTLALMKRM